MPSCSLMNRDAPFVVLKVGRAGRSGGLPPEQLGRRDTLAEKICDRK